MNGTDPSDVGDLKSLDSSIAVHGDGDVTWEIQDVHGRVSTLYVPSAGVR